MTEPISLSPLTAPEGSRTSFLLDDGGRGYLQPGCTYTVDLIGVRDCRERSTFDAAADPKGRISFEYAPALQGEYNVELHARGRSWQDEPLWRLSFYSLPADFHGLLPFKGDLHMHSFLSDGVTSPLAMAAACRMRGLDFAAITDHRIYEGSIEAIQKAASAGLDILLIPGEEVNYCLGLGHIVSIGATRSVSDALPLNAHTASRSELESFDNMERLVDQVYDGVADRPELNNLPDNVDRKLYGFYLGVVEEIHDAGGLAVAAHPFWASHGTMDLIRSTLDHVISQGIVDAVEVFGGMSDEANLLSMSYFKQPERGSGHIAFIGSSDAHSVENGPLGRIWTTVFAPELEAEAILDGIQNGLSVPCVNFDGRRVLATGAFDLVEYVYFLEREFFPYHSAACRQIGECCEPVLHGGDVCGAVSELKTRINNMYRRLTEVVDEPM